MVTIRRAIADDVPAVRELAVAAYRKYVARVGRLPAPMTADYVKAVRDRQVWVAIGEANAVVGFAVLVAQPDHLLLENIAVSPASQRQGIGGRLLALAEEHARARGLREVRLYTNEAMTENLAYYPLHGYVETHRVLQHGFRRVFFSKHLTS